MICFMFSGQPLARIEVPYEDPVFQDLARCCHERTGFNPLTGENLDSQLTENVRLQLFGSTMSLYRFSVMVGEAGLPDIVAEHSMGIYPALAATRSISDAEALELTLRIGSRLADMSREREYALASVVGLAHDSVSSLVTRHSVYIANHNTSRHFLLAGERHCIETAVAEAAGGGAFSTAIFECDAPLHTPLVREIAHDLRQIVNDYNFRDPQIPLVDHLEQKNLSAADIPIFLVEELCRPVFWETTYRTLRQRGISRFREMGHGTALTKFNRWIDSDI